MAIASRSNPLGTMDLRNWEKEDVADRLFDRASSTSVAIARSSDSKTARLSPSSFSARTLVALPGPSSSEDNTRRAFLRYGVPELLAGGEREIEWDNG